MSISRDSSMDKNYKKSVHRRKDSSELDVFEASMYFYGGTQTSAVNGGDGTTITNTLTPKTMREELRQQFEVSQRRMSLDINIRSNSINNPPPPLKQQIKEKKYKQPISPGGRLASFLNSIFNQKSSKNKKKSKSVKDHEVQEPSNEGTERRRRSSVSHFGSFWSSETKSINSSSSSDRITPSGTHAKNSSKPYEDLRRNSDYKQVSSLTKKVTNNSSSNTSLVIDEKSKNMDLTWLDEKLKLIEELSEKNKKDKTWVDDDDGGESDSSSDLFELQNYDLGIYSSGLPVYETTHIESIKRGPPISNGSF